MRDRLSEVADGSMFLRAGILLIIISLLATFRGYAQPGDESWDPRFNFSNSVDGGLSDRTYAIAAATESEVYIGGKFQYAGALPVNFITRWNGEEFEGLGTGMDAPVWAVAAGGGGVYAGGEFSTAGGDSVFSVAVWNGAGWSSLGSGIEGVVYALAVRGDTVYAGGDFKIAGGGSALHIAMWDGSGWSHLGSGMDTTVYAIAADDDYVYAGGIFTTAGGVTVNRIARWNGSAWSDLDGGVSENAGMPTSYDISVDVIEIADNGDLYAGGHFLLAGGDTVRSIARWDGESWSAIGGGLEKRVYGIGLQGGKVYAGGVFYYIPGLYLNYLGIWDGTEWTKWIDTGTDCWILALEVIGDDIYIGGCFHRVGPIYDVGGIARYRDGRWHFMSPLSKFGFDHPVSDMAVRGDDVVVCGPFTYVSNVLTRVNGLALWDGEGLSPVGGGIVCRDNWKASAVEVDSNYIYVGGAFTHVGDSVRANNIAAWDGESWHSMWPGIGDGPVYALGLCCGELYVGGNFSKIGFLDAYNIAKWDGELWHPLGDGIDGPVYAIVAIGSSVYAGGDFAAAGGVTANNIACWQNNAWHDLAGGLDGPVRALATDGGNLYVGGEFMYGSGYVYLKNIARWNGSEWDHIGETYPEIGVEGVVRAVHSVGCDLFIGGEFSIAGGIEAMNIVRYDGSNWHALGSGVGGGYYPYRPKGTNAIAMSGRGELFVGGNFQTAGATPSDYIGLWKVAVTAVDEKPFISHPFVLSQNYPNPFNPVTRIVYTLDRSAVITLEIFDCTGRLVDVLEKGRRGAGRYEVVWDGRNRRGRAVASGMYFYRLTAGTYTDTRKMVILR